MFAGLRRCIPPAHEPTDGIQRVRVIEDRQPHRSDPVRQILAQSLQRWWAIVHRNAVSGIARYGRDAFRLGPDVQRVVQGRDIACRPILTRDVARHRFVEDATHVTLRCQLRERERVLLPFMRVTMNVVHVRNARHGRRKHDAGPVTPASRIGGYATFSRRGRVVRALVHRRHDEVGLLVRVVKPAQHLDGDLQSGRFG